MQNLIQQQQVSLERLTNVLSSNVLMHHTKKWIYFLFEIGLYILFVSTLLVIIVLPTTIHFSPEQLQNVDLEIGIKELTKAILILKLILFLLSLPILLFALLFRRIRKKNELIKQAFEEVKSMKNNLLPYLKN